MQKEVSAMVDILRHGGVIAYPTEAVFGVGCDPLNEQAIKLLLGIKQRSSDKGLILIAASYKQIRPFIDESQLTHEQLNSIKASWPGAVTWIMPVKQSVSPLLTGQFDSIAVRVTAHPIAKRLCQMFGGAVTSTSANLTGQPPCKTAGQVRLQLGDDIAVLDGPVGEQKQPSEIRSAKTGEIIRAG